MFITVIEWIAFLFYLLLFVGVVVAEVRWLIRKGWATSGRSIGYVITTDLLGVGIGSGVVLTIFFIMFMMVMGPAGRGGDSPEFAYVIGMIFMVIFPPIFLIAAKRLFLLIFKIRSGKSAWIYSLVSSIVIILVLVIPPPLIYYFLDFLTKWK